MNDMCALHGAPEQVRKEEWLPHTRKYYFLQTSVQHSLGTVVIKKCSQVEFVLANTISVLEPVDHGVPTALKQGY